MHPDFLGIGAQKAGTTWLYKNLVSHPQIWMPPEKELHYFDEKRYLHSGLWARLSGDRPREVRWRRQVRRQVRRHRDEGWQGLMWSLKYFMPTPSDRWYASLFPQCDGIVTGEITPDYSGLAQARIAPIAELMPEIKIILIMRNPIERAWSHAQMELVRTKSGSPTADDFRRHFRSAGPLRLGHYPRMLRNWSAYFPPEQIYLGYMDDIHFHPLRTLESVCGFLGVAPPGKAAAAGKVHAGGITTIPTELAADLAELYLQQMRRLHRLVGGHPTRWFRMARALTSDPPSAEELRYPLWESELWPRVWDRAGPPPFMSGPAPDLNAT